MRPELHDIGRHQPRMLSVALVPEWYGEVMSPCASIRMHTMLEHLASAGRICMEVIAPEEVERTRADVFAWHRVALDMDGVRSLRAHAANIGAGLLYDLDDNLLDMDEHREREAYRPLQQAVSESLQAADVISCSTARLAERVGATRATGLVRHRPNVLDPGLWQPAADPTAGAATSAEGPLRLLYMGTRTHDDDFAFLSNCMDAAIRSGLDVELHVIGVRQRDGEGPQWLHTVPIPSRIGSSYPAFVRWLTQLRSFDVGVAPLISSKFNDCKSHVKVLDYAGIGLPAIASDMPAYSDALTDSVDVCLAANTTESWVMAMTRMLNAQARSRIAAGAFALLGESHFRDACDLRAKDLETAADRGA